ncbi:syntaxin-18-like isoform X1 [Dreissena polymorpha]|uniref:Syntaxin-18 n=1 Tax=Dreissena polymorpha TaxID=45954 RepID=A0A9D4HHJ4_DREPO|nr:syntaxin-18-like isoform X1 [Dreissena polymorpha]KAH3717021.1 hypothetical protein DPMN_059760 [Dreissena polymorpha]
MADITNLFKATVKTLKSKDKGSTKIKSKDDATQILSKPKQRGKFESLSKEVVSTISKLKEFLLEHRKEYVNAGSLLSGETSRMTDTEREHIDNEAQNIIRKCQETLATICKNAETERVHPQVKEHREGVLALINAYLKMVTKIYSEQRAVRVKRVVDKKRLARIEPEKRPARLKSYSQSESDLPDNQSTNAQSPLPGQADNQSSNAQTPPHGKTDTSKINTGRGRVPSPGPSHMEDSDDDISPEEAQMFEQENKAIYEEMNSLSEELSKIHGKVVEIASLQEIFTEKVLTQEEDIQRIADTAVFTTENIKDGNEEIREAMRKNAGFRVWILFFLLVLTFSLLFLDWYSG